MQAFIFFLFVCFSSEIYHHPQNQEKKKLNFHIWFQWEYIDQSKIWKLILYISNTVDDENFLIPYSLTSVSKYKNYRHYKKIYIYTLLNNVFSPFLQYLKRKLNFISNLSSVNSCIKQNIKAIAIWLISFLLTCNALLWGLR